MAAMERAKEMDGIGEIARGVLTPEKGIAARIGMRRAAIFGNAGQQPVTSASAVFSSDQN
jgi:hypothetical protein